MTYLRLLALEHLAELQEMNKIKKNIKSGDTVTAAIIFTYEDGSKEVTASETVTIKNLGELPV